MTKKKKKERRIALKPKSADRYVGRPNNVTDLRGNDDSREF